MTCFYIKQNDTSPLIEYALTPVSVDLTGAAVTFSMFDWMTGEVKINKAAAVIVTASGTPTVRYEWAVGDTDTASRYLAEFEVTYPASPGRTETFPNDGYVEIDISPDN